MRDPREWYWKEHGGLWEDLAPEHQALIREAYEDGFYAGWDAAKDDE